ncbi:MAG: hypothetical protein WDO13_18200 [Verrucomicrobiota bacterium]
MRNDGTVWAWGDNSAGELGNGTLTSSSQPTEVMINGTTPLTGVVAVAAGTQESFAVDNEGHVWGWGLNTSGAARHWRHGKPRLSSPGQRAHWSGRSSLVWLSHAGPHRRGCLMGMGEQTRADKLEWRH